MRTAPALLVLLLASVAVPAVTAFTTPILPDLVGIATDLGARTDCPPGYAYSSKEPFAIQYYDCMYFCEGHIYSKGWWYGECRLIGQVPATPQESSFAQVRLPALGDCFMHQSYEGDAPFAWYHERDGCTYFCEGHYYDAGQWHGSCIHWGSTAPANLD